MANESEESASSKGMLLGVDRGGKWRTAAVGDVCRPANNAIVVSAMQERAKSDDTQMRLLEAAVG